MPDLTTGGVHVNKLLTNVGLRWKNLTWIADQCCPIVPVKNKTDLYQSWHKSPWFRDEARYVAAGASAPRIGLGVTLTDSYQCITYKAAYPLARELKANADSELQIQARAAELCTNAIMLARERRVARLFEMTSDDTQGTIWTKYTTLSGTNQWSDFTNSDPVTDIDTGKASVEDNGGGLLANTCIMGVAAWRKLRRHPVITAMIFGGGAPGPKVVTPALFGQAFEFDKVLIGRGQYTADEEDTDESGITYSNIWQKHMWIGHVTNAPSVLEPSAAYMFREFYKVRSWYDDDTDTDFVEASESIDEVAVSADIGYIIENVVA